MTDDIKNPDPDRVRADLMALILQLAPTSEIERHFLETALTGKYSPDLSPVSMSRAENDPQRDRSRPPLQGLGNHDAHARAT